MKVTWQPRRVDWNTHAWTMMTSLYWSVGVVDAIERACALCGPCIQNDWVEQWTASNFALSLNTPLWKLFRWFRRPQLWATGDWQLHHDNVPAHASRLVQSSLEKHQVTQVTQPPYSPDLVPATYSFSRNVWKGNAFRLLMRFRKVWWGSYWQLGELCEVPRCLLWRALRCQCSVYNVSCIFCS